jgi:hypothetical protein
MFIWRAYAPVLRTVSISYALSCILKRVRPIPGRRAMALLHLSCADKTRLKVGQPDVVRPPRILSIQASNMMKGRADPAWRLPELPDAERQGGKVQVRSSATPQATRSAKAKDLKLEI